MDTKAPNCPKCGAVMVRRTRRSDGKPFWGCPNFFTTGCKSSINIYEPASRPAPQPQTPVQPLPPLKKYVDVEAQEFDDIKAEQDKAIGKMDAEKKANLLAAAEKIIAMMKFPPSSWQRKIYDWIINSLPGSALVVEAGAGCGKTATSLEGLKLFDPTLEIIYVAFNVSVVKEMKGKAPSFVQVRTYNSLGFAAVRAAYGNVEVNDDNNYKMNLIMNSLLPKEMYSGIYPQIRKLVSLCKGNLLTGTNEELNYLCERHDVETNGDTEIIFNTVRKALAKAKSMTKIVDFDDQIWLPVVNHLPVKKYDVIVVDEDQDTNAMQLALAAMSLKPTGKFIGIGDRNQSIYGFRGADTNAIPNIISKFHAETLQLPVSYRCPKSHVANVNQRFPNIPFFAADNAKEGSIITISDKQLTGMLKPGDLVLCRTNAQLVEPAFELIRKGVKAIIRGRDIGAGLINLIKKMKEMDDLVDMLKRITEYKDAETAKMFALEQDTKAQNLIDKVDTIVALSEGCNTVAELIGRINAVFSDDVEGVVFSSVHKAKGLEAEAVYILCPELMPHPMAKQEWAKVQEANLEYVAITRSKDLLVYVQTSEEKKKKRKVAEDAIVA